MVLVDDYMTNVNAVSNVTVVATGSPDKNLVLSNEEIKEEEHEDDQAGSTPEDVHEVPKFDEPEAAI